MLLQVTETKTTTVEVDLSTPIYRAMNGTIFAKVYETEGVAKTATIFETAFLFNAGHNMEAISLEKDWVESNESEFNEAVKKYLSANSINI